MDWEACHMRKGWENWVCSALRKESLGDTLSSRSSISRVATKKMKIPFLQGVTRKRQEVTGTNWAHSGHTLIRHKRKMFCNENKEPLKQSPKERWWIPQHWIFLRLSRTGCRAILSIWCLCQERLDQMIPEIPSILVFYDSVKN